MLRTLLAVLMTVNLSGMDTPPVNAPADTDGELQALFREAWDHELQNDPVEASVLGDRRWNDRWADLSLEAIRAHQAFESRLLERASRFDATAIPTSQRLNLDLFIRLYRDRVAAHAFPFHLLPINHQKGVQTFGQISQLLRFETVKDYEDWIARLERLPECIDQSIALMSEGIERRLVYPRVIMDRVPAQVDALLVDDPSRSEFYRPFLAFPDEIAATDRTRLSQRAQTVIAESVIPGFRKLRAFLVERYLPAAPAHVGLWQYPDGDKQYAHFVRLHTTTSLTPEQIHELGMAEVKRIRTEMQAIIDELGFKGSFADFLKFLRSDPRFYYRSPQELLDAYRAMSKRIDPTLVKLFGRLPRTPYGVVPVPDSIAPDTTTAYYQQPADDGSRAGLYYVNLYKPEARPKYEMMALSLHEAVPGHHLQVALAQEMGDLPEFRRHAGFTAFVEGWGLYAEYLGEELDLYDDAYSRFGRLTYEMWRAVRLVVDTGMHSKRWTRQQAIDFFLDNAAKQPLDVVNEIDRYIVWPGQALAYKIGELKIKELRARAKRELGDRFDVRAFHDAVLEQGAVPLDVLDKHVAAWIGRAKAGGHSENVQ
jgi:prolyl oligopeptidase